MKKVVVLGLTSLFLLTGCGSKVVCKGTTEDGGQKIKMKITATIKSDKVSKASATMTFSDKKTAEQTCGFLALAAAMSEEAKDLDYKCKGKTLEVKNYELMEDGIKGATKDSFIKSMKEQGLTCK